LPHLPLVAFLIQIGETMNILNFEQTTSYFTKKRPIVFILFLFSLICLIVSIQSGAVFINSFLSAYLPGVSWFWCYLVAVAIDIVLFYLCAQLFSDLFCGLDGQKRYLDLPTTILFLSFLALSLFMSIKGADVRKSHHNTIISSDKTTALTVGKMLASVDTSKTIVSKNITRNERKAIEQKANLARHNATNQKQLLSALHLHNKQQEEAKKEFSDLLDFSKSIVVIFQLLLIVCCACSEFIKSKKESKSKSMKALLKVDESTAKADESGKSESKSKKESKNNTIGFFGSEEGHILNKKIAFKKANGQLKYYSKSNLTSLISDAKKSGKQNRAKRFEGLKEQLKNSLV